MVNKLCPFLVGVTATIRQKHFRHAGAALGSFPRIKNPEGIHYSGAAKAFSPGVLIGDNDIERRTEMVDFPDP